MPNPNPPGDQITGSAGDNTRNVAVGKEITLHDTTVTVSGDHNQVYVGSRKVALPLHYPPRAEHFVDREAALAQLLADLHPGHVVTLCGPGGIGKTALAAEAIAKLGPDLTKAPDRFPDGIFFHSFYNQQAAALALEQIARSFGEEPRPTPALAAQRALAGKRALLILDGAEDADDLPAVLAIRGQCGVLVSSRLRKDAVATPQPVPPLPLDEAVALLQAWGGPRAADALIARQICALVGELPLAVRLVGRYLAETDLTAAEYLTWLQATPLQALNQGDRREQSVNVLLERSVARLSDAAQQALGVVGVLALAPFPAQWVALTLAQEPSPASSRPLGELINYGLLLRQDDGQYTVSHALIHTYAAQTVPVAAVERLATYFNQFARQQRELGPLGFAALDVVLPHLLRVLDHCVQCSLWSPANQLVWAVQSYLDVHGRWLERVRVAQAGVQVTRHLGKHYDEGAHFSHLGLTYSDLGQLDKAIEHYQAALIIYQKIGDRRGEGADLGNLGSAYGDLGQVDEAIKYYQQALAIAREIGDRRGEGADLGNLGSAYLGLGQVGEAIKYYQQALAIAREIGDRRGEGNHLGNLGNAYLGLGQVGEAVEYSQQALAIAREIVDRRGEGNHLGNLGSAYLQLEKVKDAIEYYKQALTIAREIGDHNLQASLLSTLGLSECIHNENDELANSLLDESISILQETKHASSLVQALLVQGGIKWVQHLDTEAKDKWEYALSIANESGFRPLQNGLQMMIALIEGEAGNESLAIEALQISASEWRAMGLNPQILDFIQKIMKVIESGNYPE